MGLYHRVSVHETLASTLAPTIIDPTLISRDFAVRRWTSGVLQIFAFFYFPFVVSLEQSHLRSDSFFSFVYCYQILLIWGEAISLKYERNSVFYWCCFSREPLICVDTFCLHGLNQVICIVLNVWTVSVTPIIIIIILCLFVLLFHYRSSSNPSIYICMNKAYFE